MDEATSVDGLIDGIIDREGGYSNHPADKGGADLFRHYRSGRPGARLCAARCANCRERKRRPSIAGFIGYGRASTRSPGAAGGCRASCSTPASTWGRRSPSPSSSGRSPRSTATPADYPDLTPDGRVGAGDARRARPLPRAARLKKGGETVLLRALEALQGERYLRLAERRPANEAFLYGWLANRIGDDRR